MFNFAQYSLNKPKIVMTLNRFLFLLIFFSTQIISGQEKFTLSGTIKDSTDGEDLIGVYVTVANLSGVGTITNSYGFYSITLPQGEYTISFSYVGYNTVDKKIVLDKNKVIGMELSNSSEVMKALEVTAEKENENLTNTNGSAVRLKPKDIETIPVLFGEKDVLKTVTLLPGVQSAGEGSSGFNVRGGASDQNLILLDEAPVYNASHLLGFFSVFNSDALKDINLMKGGIPAEYGGRLSSVMDIKMKEGNRKKFSASGGLGLISSRLLIEAPIVKDKGSFFVSGRRTYADTFLKLSKDSSRRESTLYFYDINAKANYSFGEKDRVFLSGYFGQDKFGFGDSFGFEWGNTTGTLRWNHIYSNNLFSNTSVIYSNYDYKITIGGAGFDIASVIKDWTFKQDYQWFANEKHNVKFGFNVLTHKISPGGINSLEPDGIIADLNVQEKRSIEASTYILDEWKISNRISANYGLRYSSFYAIGEQDVYSYDENGSLTDTTTYGKNEVFQQYQGLEPRIATTFMLNEYSSMKASYSRGYQYLHLLTNSTSSSPTDIWMPSSNNIKPQLSDQFTVGYFRNFKDNTYEFSIESYYKPMNNLIDYKTGAEVLLNEFVEGELVFGVGRAYGAEILIRKNKGKFTGWVGYTLARTEKKFEEINSSNWFPARQDRIHDISIVAMYSFSEKVKASANWVYYTGNAVTFPSGKYQIDGVVANYYTERNGYRMPDYHRLDIGVTLYNDKYKTIIDPEKQKEIKVKKKWESNWNFSVYNAYARENAYQISFRESESNPGQTEAVQLALFKIIPSIAYNFKF